LIETSKEVNLEDIQVKLKSYDFTRDQSIELILYNKDNVVHKLSHQHLYTKFWIIKLKDLKTRGIPLSDVRDYAVPILIGNFIVGFNL
jgi:A/G-specific adenine glycosylase